MQIKLTAIDINFQDCLRFFYNTNELPPLQNVVKVGIIYTGVGPHKDLQVAGGANTIEGEDEKEFEPEPLLSEVA